MINQRKKNGRIDQSVRNDLMPRVINQDHDIDTEDQKEKDVVS
mgnify:CR=1 FL=1